MKFIWLYIIVTFGDGSTKHWRSPHLDYRSCYNALFVAKVVSSHGAENEQTVIAFCGDERLERISDTGNWYTIQNK